MIRPVADWAHGHLPSARAGEKLVNLGYLRAVVARFVSDASAVRSALSEAGLYRRRDCAAEVSNLFDMPDEGSASPSIADQLIVTCSRRATREGCLTHRPAQIAGCHCLFWSGCPGRAFVVRDAGDGIAGI
jgi:hypothetical protein